MFPALQLSLSNADEPSHFLSRIRLLGCRTRHLIVDFSKLSVARDLQPAASVSTGVFENKVIAAIPAAPASTHDRAFSSVIPPSANAGIFTDAETRRNSSNPLGA